MAGVALALKDDCIPERHRRKIELTDKTAQVVAEETRSPSSRKKGKKPIEQKKTYGSMVKLDIGSWMLYGGRGRERRVLRVDAALQKQSPTLVTGQQQETFSPDVSLSVTPLQRRPRG